jgi:hypothetical protein
VVIKKHHALLSLLCREGLIIKTSVKEYHRIKKERKKERKARCLDRKLTNKNGKE